MFRLIEATSYRCLRSIDQELNPFEILVGANASGKSTFLDVFAFLGTFVSRGIEVAVEQRTRNFHDLVWGREGTDFLLGVRAVIPPERRTHDPLSAKLGFPASGLPQGDVVGYTVQICLDTQSETLHVASEYADLYSSQATKRPRHVLDRKGPKLKFTSETASESFEREQHRNYSALGSLPGDAAFPAAAWLRELLREGIRTVALEPKALAQPSPLALGDPSRITGSSLARSVAQLKAEDSARFQDWLSHVRTALPDVRSIDSVLREEDKHRYVMIHYENGVRVPSWVLSEGTLRLLALTILAYLPDFHGVYLVEEPENGVHPTALETIYQSLSSVYDAQVLVATHSPILLNMASPDQILCFSKTADGARIVRGTDHPALQQWRKEVSLGTLAASGILG